MTCGRPVGCPSGQRSPRASQVLIWGAVLVDRSSSVGKAQRSAVHRSVPAKDGRAASPRSNNLDGSMNNSRKPPWSRCCKGCLRYMQCKRHGDMMRSFGAATTRTRVSSTRCSTLTTRSGRMRCPLRRSRYLSTERRSPEALTRGQAASSSNFTLTTLNRRGHCGGGVALRLLRGGRLEWLSHVNEPLSLERLPLEQTGEAHKAEFGGVKGRVTRTVVDWRVYHTQTRRFYSDLYFFSLVVAARGAAVAQTLGRLICCGGRTEGPPHVDQLPLQEHLYHQERLHKGPDVQGVWRRVIGVVAARRGYDPSTSHLDSQLHYYYQEQPHARPTVRCLETGCVWQPSGEAVPRHRAAFTRSLVLTTTENLHAIFAAAPAAHLCPFSFDSSASGSSLAQPRGRSLHTHDLRPTSRVPIRPTPLRELHRRGRCGGGVALRLLRGGHVEGLSHVDGLLLLERPHLERTGEAHETQFGGARRRVIRTVAAWWGCHIRTHRFYSELHFFFHVVAARGPAVEETLGRFIFCGGRTEWPPHVDQLPLQEHLYHQERMHEGPDVQGVWRRVIGVVAFRKVYDPSTSHLDCQLHHYYQEQLQGGPTVGRLETACVWQPQERLFHAVERPLRGVFRSCVQYSWQALSGWHTLDNVKGSIDNQG
ncbi:hypothetical protein HPB50_011774 [Hyalomma asiaticum]|uniref:Uncharacterized protein n=1 Tax=Hyalomma asiaticum TaxID=266040 RepID=A0ACB7TIT1_HYAAI|nr:hypothetical protein HPB50_011774 [Hyalomma asiaticum]